jgi:malyl-CoA/(S)-citramalyl-CoA lyase
MRVLIKPDGFFSPGRGERKRRKAPGLMGGHFAASAKSSCEGPRKIISQMKHRLKLDCPKVCQMSFRLQPAPPARPNRCQLFGPGSRPELFAKMAASAADVINLDLEDSVAPADKPQARANIIRAIGEVDWGQKTLSVRINGLDTPFWYRDVVDLLEQAGERLDQIMIPKVGCAADVYAVDALVTACEAAAGRKKRISLEVIIETAAGIAHVEEIAASSPRLQAMSLGAADFAASMGMQTTGIGGTQENYYMHREGQRYWSDPWHWAQAAIVAACRTHGVLPVDGPFGDFSDEEGFRAQARRSATLGMVGKWAIHPKQVALANEVFTPSEAAVTEARDILAAMEAAKAAGQGAAVYKGRLVDIASMRQAEVIVRQAEIIAGAS